MCDAARKAIEGIKDATRTVNSSDQASLDILLRKALKRTEQETKFMQTDKKSFEATIDELLEAMEACQELKAENEIQHEKIKRYERICLLREVGNTHLTEKCERLEQELKDMRPGGAEIDIAATNLKAAMGDEIEGQL